MYAKLSDVRNLEHRTLKAITEIAPFAKLNDLVSQASAALGRYSPKGPIDFHLGFLLDIRLRGDRHAKLLERRVDLGVLVQGDATSKDKIGNVSYSLLICKYKEPATSPILRKAHFDYESAAWRNQSEPKPSVHMQICGKYSPHHTAAGYGTQRLNALYPGFEKPRIPLAPTSLALMLNWLLLEFQNGSAAQPILKDEQWRRLVSDAERVVLRPYFDGGAKYLNSARNAGQRFLQSFIYEMAD